MNKELMFSSNKQNWRTPGWLFDQLNAEFHFNVDLCADDENHLCEEYYTEQNDGMNADLTGKVVFCNPPYIRLKKWVQKCAESNAKIAVMLIPARTDTAAFHDYIWGKSEIRFLRGRLSFGGGSDRAPFPSMIVIFRSGENE